MIYSEYFFDLFFSIIFRKIILILLFIIALKICITVFTYFFLHRESKHFIMTAEGTLLFQQYNNSRSEHILIFLTFFSLCLNGCHSHFDLSVTLFMFMSMSCIRLFLCLILCLYLHPIRKLLQNLRI